MHTIDDVVRQFRNGLTDLVQYLDGTGLTPDTFVGFIGNLKSLISEIGLRAFSETVLRHEEASDIVECGGQHVLNLRTHVLSKRWDVFWDTYMGGRQAA